MKFKLKFSLILSVLFYVLFLYYLWRKLDLPVIFQSFHQARISFLVLALIAGFLMVCSQAWLLYRISRLCSFSVSYFESLTLWLSAVTASTFTAGLGGPAMIFLRTRKKENSRLATHLISTFYLFYAVPNFLLVILGGGIFFSDLIIHSDLFFWTILFLAAVACLLFILARSSSFFKSILSEAKMVLGRFSKIEMLKVLFISGLEIVFNFLIFYFVIRAFGLQISPVLIIKNFIVIEILAIFSPTGGGAGAVELGLTGSLTLSGLSLASIASVVLSYRLINFWLPFVGGGFLFGLQSKKIFSRN